MNSNDMTMFSAQMHKLAVVFKTDLSRDLIETYFKALRHLSIGRITAAVETACAECQWFPKPVELAEMSKSPERYEPQMDGDVCGMCHGAGLILRDTPHGTFGAPCRCTGGRRVAETWANTSVGVAAAQNRDKLSALMAQEPTA